MAFLKARAENYFFDVYVEWDRLHFQFPRPAAIRARAGVGQEPVQLQPAHLRGGHGRAAGRSGTTTRSWHRPSTCTALAADFDVDNLVEKLGSAALDLLSSLVRQGILQHSVKNPLDAAELAKLAAGRPAGRNVRRLGIVRRHPGPDRRAATSPSRASGAGSAAPTGRARSPTGIERQRLHDRLLDHPAQPLQPARACCASS